MSFITDRLYLGDIDNAMDAVNIGDWIVITCAAEADIVSNHKVCLYDGRQKNTGLILASGADIIHETLTHTDKNVLVHCMAGASRSPSVIIAYLMKYQGMKFGDAYCMVREKRPVVSIHRHFENVLKSMKL